MWSVLSPWRNSLSFRLLAAYIVAWLMMATLFVSVGSWALREDGRWLDHGAERSAQELVTQMHYDDQGRPNIADVHLPGQLQWIFGALPRDAGYLIFDDAGQPVSWSSNSARENWQRAGLTEPPRQGRGSLVLDEVKVHTATQSFIGRDSRRYWLQVALSERLSALRHDEMSNAFMATLGLATIASIALLALVLFLLLKWQFAPLQRASTEAQLIEPREPWRRLGTEGLPSEILPLVRSFNLALGRLEKGFELQQHFLADAAHELKTPLALLKAQIETGHVATTQMLHDIDHMSRQIQQLLMLAEVSELRSYLDEPIDVAGVAGDVVAFLLPLASQHCVDLITVGRMNAEIRGDRSALFVLLKNLVENAIGASPEGATVSIFIDNERIRVLDQGPGIAPEHHPMLFHRFWRVPGSSYGGAGLGLAICQEVVNTHNWQLTIRNAEPGAEFALDFRASAPQDRP